MPTGNRDSLTTKLVPVSKIQDETNLKPYEQLKAQALADTMVKLDVLNLSPLYATCENRFIPKSKWFLIKPSREQLIILEACRICKEGNHKDYEMCYVIPVEADEIPDTLELMELMGL